MKELLEIIETAKKHGGPAALATVIQTTGSSYRRPGARMLVLPDGRTVGCISGGCLDRDIVAQALNVIKNQKPALISYDTRSEDDIVFGAGLGCKGVIEIFIEYSNPGSSFLERVEELIRRRRTTTVATVVGAGGNIGLTAGDRVLLDDLGNLTASLKDIRGLETLARDARGETGRAQPRVVSHEVAMGSAQIFVETIFPPVNLVILGAGQDAIPLARLAHELGLRVIVIDGRPGYATRARFPTAAEIVVLSPEELFPGQIFDARTAAVIMTHNYLIDQSWLRGMLPKRLPYLGLMGPRKRAERMLMELSAEGLEAGQSELSALHNPVGLDIGAETPEQIALAVLAEVQAALTAREGGKLKNKKGTIHMRPVDACPERKSWAVLA